MLFSLSLVKMFHFLEGDISLFQRGNFIFIVFSYSLIAGHWANFVFLLPHFLIVKFKIFLRFLKLRFA